MLAITGGVWPDLIKMDIEGSEGPFLQNENWSRQVFPNCHLMVELHSPIAREAHARQRELWNDGRYEEVGEYHLTTRVEPS